MTDSIFFNGTLLTQDPAKPRAEALAVDGGRIAAVGTREDIGNLAGPHTRPFDLGGRTLIPSFNDAHVHVWKLGHLLTTMLDLRGVESIGELQEMLRAASLRLPSDAWLLGRGYNEARMKEGRQPTRADLDAAVSDRRVYLTRTCGHMGVANGRALEAAGIHAGTADPPGGVIVRDESGEPTGLVQENAIDLLNEVIPEPTPDEYRAMIEAASRHQHRAGITSATDPGVRPALLDVYRSLADEGMLRSRFNAMLLHEQGKGSDSPPHHESDFLRFDSIKFFADGGLSGATAALREPYRHAATRGVLRLEEGELFEAAERAERSGLHVGTHAIGDAAIDRVLAVYERLAGPRPGRRRRLEHFGLPDVSQMGRAARLGVHVAAQPVFLHSLGENFRRYLPEGYLSRCYPLKDMLEVGLQLALSSDAPVVEDDNPLLGIQAAVLRSDRAGEGIAPEQAITVAQALYAYTMGGALASGDASNRGSLSPGKWADLVLLDRNPLEIDVEALAEVGVDGTFVGGEIVYER
jgi:predicted amidohydrolase YtcJ